MNRSRDRIAAGVLLAALVSAHPAWGYPERAATYRCGGAYGFSAIYEKTGAVLVMIAGGAYRLQPRGDGTWADRHGQKLVVGRQGAVWRSAADGVRRCRAERRSR